MEQIPPLDETMGSANAWLERGVELRGEELWLKDHPRRLKMLTSLGVNSGPWGRRDSPTHTLCQSIAWVSKIVARAGGTIVSREIFEPVPTLQGSERIHFFAKISTTFLKRLFYWNCVWNQYWMFSFPINHIQVVTLPGEHKRGVVSHTLLCTGEPGRKWFSFSMRILEIWKVFHVPKSEQKVKILKNVMNQPSENISDWVNVNALFG